MGAALNGCITCDSSQLHSNTNQLHQISSYYSARLGEYQQIHQDIPHYQDVNHARLANDLHMRQQKFQDMISPSQYLLKNPRIQWKRITEVFPHQKFSRGISNFQFQYDNSTGNKSEIVYLEKALEKLSVCSQLVQKMFANTDISKQGFYVLYFCVSGNIQKRIQVIVDDYIPVDEMGRYRYQSPKPGDGIWMIIVEKAWAKIFRSYHDLNKLNSNQYFSEMTGVPIPQLYRKDDFIMSAKYDFEPHQSKYLKIFRDTPANMIACVWEPTNHEIFLKQNTQSDFIIQAFVETRQNQTVSYKCLPLSTSTVENKLILHEQDKKDMFELKSGQYILHIFNRNRSKRQCNIVIHARKPVNAHTRYEKQFQQAKMLMIKNQYKKKHSTISIQFQHPGIQLRFCWMKHRGVFCFKNKSQQTKLIQMKIKTQFYGQIFFQDAKLLCKQVVLKPKQFGFFVVIRTQDRQYGPFYQIKIKKSS